MRKHGSKRRSMPARLMKNGGKTGVSGAAMVDFTRRENNRNCCVFMRLLF